MAGREKNNSVTKDVQTDICFHCGDACDSENVLFQEKHFCCHGCKSVYELLQSCNLGGYYAYAENPGIKQLKAPQKSEYAYLDNEEIKQKVVAFSNDSMVRVKLVLPAIHCASCIWLIENFRKLVPGIIESRVNFVTREVHFSYDPSELSLRHLVEQLAAIGYPPELKLDKTDAKKQTLTNKRLIYQIGVAGFCFGNIMLLSFPDYIAGSAGVADQYRRFFGYLNFILALPVLLYSANDYLRSGLLAVTTRRINMDVPISLGVLALFFRSTYSIFYENGGGYMDSLAALIFFLLIGKWIQQKTYDGLSFERDYKSYFPIAVQAVQNGKEMPVPIENLKTGDHLRVRSGELVPADARLIDGAASIDYSFVSGESDLVSIPAGAKIYAGGRQMGASILLEVLKPVDQSYLTSLWNSGEDEKTGHPLEVLADRVGRRFTYVVVGVAISTAVFWLIRDSSIALDALSSVLIVACPCALALSFPFAFGNAMRLLGRQGFYLKSAHALAKMAEVTTVVFDKTGTLTRKMEEGISYSGNELSFHQKSIFAAMAAQSGHPLSRHIAHYFANISTTPLFDSFREIPGKGLEAVIGDTTYLLGSAVFLKADNPDDRNNKSSVYIGTKDAVLGAFSIQKAYRKGLNTLFRNLKNRFTLFLISGDDASERAEMEMLFGQKEGLFFNQSPHEKKQFITSLKNKGEVVAMVGDGLNDSGALAKSDFGVSVADDVFRFAPASDAILFSENIARFDAFFRFSKQCLNLVKASFVFSFLYNGIGVFFAAQGLLTPVIAAILMPLSSITVVLFVTIGSQVMFYKNFSKSQKMDKNRFLK